jgi:hypothetical protein
MYSNSNFLATSAYDAYDLFYYCTVYEIKKHLL